MFSPDFWHMHLRIKYEIQNPKIFSYMSNNLSDVKSGKEPGEIFFFRDTVLYSKIIQQIQRREISIEGQ